jgi:hypothetical protein
MVYSSPAEASPGRLYPRRTPPGPRGSPLVGNLLALGKDPLGFFTGTTRQYGDLVSLNLAGWPTLLVSDLSAIESVLVEDHRSYAKNSFFWRNVTAVFKAFGRTSGFMKYLNSDPSYQQQEKS